LNLQKIAGSGYGSVIQNYVSGFRSPINYGSTGSGSTSLHKTDLKETLGIVLDERGEEQAEKVEEEVHVHSVTLLNLLKKQGHEKEFKYFDKNTYF
jgi:hypothetical protein